MQLNKVRARIVSDHAALRRMLEGLEVLAERVAGGDQDLTGVLGNRAEALVATLVEHMCWEDRYLAPALREADARGVERAAKLASDHAKQREILLPALEGLQHGGCSPTLLARDLVDLVAVLRRDMEEEELPL